MTKLSLRPYQSEAISSIKQAWDEGFKNVLLVLPTGCHARGERVLLYSGDWINVEDVRVGMQLMGRDSTPRTVLNTIITEDDIYRVKVRRRTFRLGSNHLCSVIHRHNPSIIIERSVKSISEHKKYYREMYKFFRIPIQRCGNPYKIIDSTAYAWGALDRKNMRISNEAFRLDYQDRVDYMFGFLGVHSLGGQMTYCDMKKGNEALLDKLCLLCDSVYYKYVINKKAGPLIRFWSNREFYEDLRKEGTPSAVYESRGECHGFEVSGDRRYVMDGYFVTHNCGKTIVFNTIASDFAKEGRNVLIIAHREELINQAIDKFVKWHSEIPYSIEKEKQFGDLSHRIIIASKDSLCIDKRLARYPKDFFDLIIVDEAHHCLADTYMKIFDYFSTSKVLGVTATPDRGDQRKLNSFFETKAYEYELAQAIKDGWLAPIIARTANINVDISKVKNAAGDFAVGELEEAVSPYFMAVAQYMQKHIPTRKAIVFTPRIDGAVEMAIALRACGFTSTSVAGVDKDRKDKIEGFSLDKYQTICCSKLLVEGYDEPSVDCIINLSPTQSDTFFRQCNGRGTRLHPKKENLLLIDVIWQTNREIYHPSRLIAESDSIANSMRDFLISNCNKSYNLIDLHYFVDAFVNLRHMEAARKTAQIELKGKGAKSYKTLAFLLRDESLFGYEPVFKWESQKPTDRQVETLGKFGIIVDKNITKGFANLIIRAIIKRCEEKLCTPKQMFVMAKMGIIEKLVEMKFEVASGIMDAVAKNYWKPNLYIQKNFIDAKNTLETPLIDYTKLKMEPIQEGDRACADNSIL